MSDDLRRRRPPDEDDPLAALIRQFIDPNGPPQPFAGTPFRYHVPSEALAYSPAEWTKKRDALKARFEPQMTMLRERIRTLQDARESARGILAGSTRRDLDVKIGTSSRELGDVSLDLARAQAELQVEEDRAKKAAQENREEVRQAYNDWIQHPQRVAEGIAAVSKSYVEAGQAADDARMLKATAPLREAAITEEFRQRRATAAAARAEAELKTAMLERDKRVFDQAEEYALTMATKVSIEVLNGDEVSTPLHVACARFVIACAGMSPEELGERLCAFAAMLIQSGAVGPQAGSYRSGIR